MGLKLKSELQMYKEMIYSDIEYTSLEMYIKVLDMMFDQVLLIVDNPTSISLDMYNSLIRSINYKLNIDVSNSGQHFPDFGHILYKIDNQTWDSEKKTFIRKFYEYNTINKVRKDMCVYYKDGTVIYHDTEMISEYHIKLLILREKY